MVTLLICGTIFIWPVFTPIKFRKMHPLQASLYLFLSCIGCTILGILITFAPAGMFTSHMAGTNTEIISLIQNQWGITPNVDQEVGGLIMWVPACFIYVTYIMITLRRWYLVPEAEEAVAQSGISRE